MERSYGKRGRYGSNRSKEREENKEFNLFWNQTDHSQKKIQEIYREEDI